MDVEELNIQHGLPGRPESPVLERFSRLAVEAAMKELVGSKLLYQKVVVELSGLQKAFETGGVGAAPERTAELQTEIAKRPWRLETRHFGDDPQVAQIMHFASAGAQPLGTPLEDRNLHFYAPSASLRCRQCSTMSVFTAILGSTEQRLGHPFPRNTSRGMEQIYTILYRCEGCRQTIHAILIRREGMRLHLCGFAPRREHPPHRQVPADLEPILTDSVNALAEGDLFAACYHLRTMVEFFLKGKVGIPLLEQIRGEELVSRYYQTVPVELRGVLPSLKVAYETLSRMLHSRTGSTEEFSAQLTAVCDHIESAQLLAKYSKT